MEQLLVDGTRRQTTTTPTETTATASGLSVTKAMGFVCYCLFDETKTVGLQSIGATSKQTQG